MTNPRYYHRDWRVVRSDYFSFNADTLPFFVEYRSIFGIWRKLPHPHWIGPAAFPSNDAAVEWINAHKPLSIIECDKPAIAKPVDWNDRQLASGRYGDREAIKALARLAGVQ